MIATDRISAFDVVLPKGIPFKGQVLNQIAAKFLDATSDICPNWKLATPDPMVTVGLKCEGFRVEMIIRSILTGSAWRAYKEGCRDLWGVKLPEGMRENERFPEPIVTPTTKADEGHDMNISREEIIAQGLVSKEDYDVIEDYTKKLFKRGQEIAAKQGLILVDTKYEFGKRDGKIYLIDEIHTPDSSRYFYADGYEEKLAAGKPSPKFSNYENFNGGTSSLDDFKGKVTYIDVWATWCLPCRGEIPALKELEKKFQGKDVAFVSISIDENKEDWKQFVKNEDLKGVQLIADGAFNAQFIEDYGIRQIPTFIIIDKEGKIVNADAPRPSSEEITGLLEGLLKK